MRLILIASLTAFTIQGQLAPLQAQNTPRVEPGVEKPILPPQVEIPTEKPRVPRAEPPASTLSRRGLTESANTNAILHGIQIVHMRRDHIAVKYVIKGFRDLCLNPSYSDPESQEGCEIIVERKGACDWVRTSLDGSEAPTSRPRTVADRLCRQAFDRYTERVNHSLNRNSFLEDHSLVVTFNRDHLDKVETGKYYFWTRFMYQPVKVIKKGPGARVTEFRLDLLPCASSSSCTFFD